MTSNDICTLIYSSAACNRFPHTLDWGTNGLICYAACNAVHLYDYKEQGGVLLTSLNGHKGKVTSVHWIKGTDNELLSTSADHTACIWTISGKELLKREFLVSHKDVVQNASGICLKNELKQVVATISTDSTLKIWERLLDQPATCFQTISFGNGFGLDVKFAQLTSCSSLMMLVSADDSKIHIYTLDDLNQFNFALSLAGHEDWIPCLDIVSKDEDLFVASASQDSYIRLWKISPQQSCKTRSNELLKVEEVSFKTSKNITYSINLESVLSGHENRVYSVRWLSQKDGSQLNILSTSMDKTMIIWEIDSSSNMWIEKVRVGEVGGNTLGFYGGVFSPDGKTILAHGYQGAIHVWKLNEVSNEWQPGIAFGGHFSPVCDIDWDPYGEYLMSCSSDQTTRIHASYISKDWVQWLEIARPQVHGYDMVCLAVMNRFQLVSAGDEKVLRVFQAPRSFAEAFQNISKIDTSSYIAGMAAEGASVPSLGLSNKAVYEEDLNRMNDSDLEKHPKDRYPEFYYTPLHLLEPPTEETLLQNTLWPEVQKLYGHPFEVFAVASSNSNNLVASACKASKAEHAAIILWDTLSWKQLGKLIFHNLTVTQLQFSPSDEFLLSVSRDRTWAVYQHCPNQTPPYKLIANLEKKNDVHTRIIWSCAWSFNSLYFATSSRDKKVAMWGRTNEDSNIKFSLIQKPLEVEDSATAVSIAPCVTFNNRYILAVGLEKGHIILCSWCQQDGFVVKQKIEENIAHHLTVNRLKFSPVKGEAGNRNNTEITQLASCSNDYHLKIYNIYIHCFS